MEKDQYVLNKWVQLEIYKIKANFSETPNCRLKYKN